jgi:hypothetical protein
MKAEIVESIWKRFFPGNGQRRFHCYDIGKQFPKETDTDVSYTTGMFSLTDKLNQSAKDSLKGMVD